MNKKILGLAILLSISTNLMANSIYESSNHNEVTTGGIGLIAGTLVAGPLGAIIGGSLGVMTGHHQTQAETISEQQQILTLHQQTITELESELKQMVTTLDKAEKSAQYLESKQALNQQQHFEDLSQFATSYQLDIYFLTNSTELHPIAQDGLRKLSELLQRHPQLQANLEAHSDWRGSNDDNCLLAKRRLSQVNNHLTQAGVNPSQLLATNYGERHNYDTSTWGEALFYDRRVTISLNYFAD
ncbi:MAG: hypothetical protein COC04_04715 [Gammaproteobacteria bacterium]|nr:MAG: hypothetical protein COC04_04715 [Gammaproteobacteria bacterium]